MSHEQPRGTPALPAETLAALDARLGAGRVRRRVPLAKYTSFRLGGPADALYTARTADELAAAILAARELGVPHFLLGLGANILVGDRGFRGLVIRNRAKHFKFRAAADGSHALVTAESGAVMQDLVLEAVERGWSGLEHFIGIPSTVGGAIWQNLHFLSPAPERERTMFIADVFHACDILSRRTSGGRCTPTTWRSATTTRCSTTGATWCSRPPSGWTRATWTGCTACCTRT
jgi:UDP-N-acetylmuramate dehydrogenase